jgi:arginine exporter protein ArgO
MARTPKIMAVQGAAVLVGAAFLVFGALGFIPGVTTHYDRLQWAGHHSGAELFGVFAVSGLHNVIHLIFGVLGLLMARTYAKARAYFLIGGLVYLGLWVYGLLIDHGGPANFVPVNSADNWLHLGLGAVMLLLAVTLAGQHDPTKRRPRRKKTKQTAQA